MQDTSSKAHCPLCAAPNDCALENDQSHCWCMSDELTFSPALCRQASEAKPQSCICATCARTQSYHKSP
ncbi:MAG: cysteine-rich CWC family protein [Porticoccaceae bacterium]|nr:cysteine-rich CWC family protein [Porticoccaceae bacterium]